MAVAVVESAAAAATLGLSLAFGAGLTGARRGFSEWNGMDGWTFPKERKAAAKWSRSRNRNRGNGDGKRTNRDGRTDGHCDSHYSSSMQRPF